MFVKKVVAREKGVEKIEGWREKKRQAKREKIQRNEKKEKKRTHF